MITISFVVISLVFAFVVSFIVIGLYYHKVKNNSQDIPEGLKNTDIYIDNEAEEIKIICQ